MLISGAGVPDARKIPPSPHGVFEANSGHLVDANWASHFEDIAGAIDWVTTPGGSGSDDPAVWHAVEVPPPPSRAWMGYSALAALALAVSAVLIWRYLQPALGVNLDDPTTWSVPPVAEKARSPVAVGALRLATLELQASTQGSGENAGYNVSRREGNCLLGLGGAVGFGLGNIRQRPQPCREPDLNIGNAPPVVHGQLPRPARPAQLVGMSVSLVARQHGIARVGEDTPDTSARTGIGGGKGASF